MSENTEDYKVSNTGEVLERGIVMSPSTEDNAVPGDADQADQVVQNEEGSKDVSSPDTEGSVDIVEPVEQASKRSRKEIKEEIKQENLQALRASRKQLQRERDEYMVRLQVLEAAQAKKATLESEGDDDYIDPTQKELKQMRGHISDMAESNSRTKLQTQYPDFKSVVNDESIAILKQRFPEVAYTLDRSTDLYATGVSAYNIIKKFGIHIAEDIANAENIVQKYKVESNVAKPRPVSSIKSASALAHASDYSDLSNKEVRDEIIRIATERADG